MTMMKEDQQREMQCVFSSSSVSEQPVVSVGAAAFLGPILEGSRTAQPHSLSEESLAVSSSAHGGDFRLIFDEKG
jgi:hypothetical protein